MAVVTTASDVDSTTIAVRCREGEDDQLMYWDAGRLTAIEVKNEAQTDWISSASASTRTRTAGGVAKRSGGGAYVV